MIDICSSRIVTWADTQVLCFKTQEVMKGLPEIRGEHLFLVVGFMEGIPGMLTFGLGLGGGEYIYQIRKLGQSTSGIHMQFCVS